MEPEDEAELARLKAIHVGAVEFEAKTRRDLYAFIQRLLQQGKHGTLTELIGKTGYSRQRLGDIKAGKWSRTAANNPPEGD